MKHDEALNLCVTPEQTIRFTGEDGLGGARDATNTFMMPRLLRKA